MMIGDRYPVARVAHACEYCGEGIPKGQRYRRWAWVVRGSRPATVHAHIACDAVAQDYYDRVSVGVEDDERWVHEVPLLEWAREHGANVRGELSALAGRTSGWPDGEADRLAAWMTRGAS
jgi:hypothetical protein